MFETIQVAAYSGYKANEQPVSFEFRGRHYRVVEVTDRWYEGYTGSAPLDYYRVTADDGQQYLLRYNSLFDAWSIALPP